MDSIMGQWGSTRGSGLGQKFHILFQACLWLKYQYLFFRSPRPKLKLAELNVQSLLLDLVLAKLFTLSSSPCPDQNFNEFHSMVNFFFWLLLWTKVQSFLPARATDGMNGNSPWPIWQNELRIRQNPGPIRQNQGLWPRAKVQYSLSGLVFARQSISCSGLPRPKLELVQLNVQSLLSGPGSGPKFNFIFQSLPRSKLQLVPFNL